MPYQDYLKKDIEAALTDVHELRRELLEFAEIAEIEPAARELRMPVADDFKEFRNRVADLLERINSLLGEIVSSETARGPEGGVVFYLSTLAGELHAQLEWLRGVLEQIDNMIKKGLPGATDWFIAQVTNPVGMALSKIKSYLMPLLKKFLSKIWQIISNLLTPKEWKLKGEIGTGIFGLANVGIEITFG